MPAELKNKLVGTCQLFRAFTNLDGENRLHAGILGEAVPASWQP